ncbi:hypothetical protein ACPV5U_19230 [Vibrio mediterranei]
MHHYFVNPHMTLAFVNNGRLHLSTVCSLQEHRDLSIPKIGELFGVRFYSDRASLQIQQANRSKMYIVVDSTAFEVGLVTDCERTANEFMEDNDRFAHMTQDTRGFHYLASLDGVRVGEIQP